MVHVEVRGRQGVWLCWMNRWRLCVVLFSKAVCKVPLRVALMYREVLQGSHRIALARQYMVDRQPELRVRGSLGHSKMMHLVG